MYCYASVKNSVKEKASNKPQVIQRATQPFAHTCPDIPNPFPVAIEQERELSNERNPLYLPDDKKLLKPKSINPLIKYLQQNYQETIVGGHLINASFEGMGHDIADNLFPITQQANNQHKNQVENLIKRRTYCYNPDAQRGASHDIEGVEPVPCMYKVRVVPLTGLPYTENNFGCQFQCTIKFNDEEKEKTTSIISKPTKVIKLDPSYPLPHGPVYPIPMIAVQPQIFSDQQVALLLTQELEPVQNEAVAILTPYRTLVGEPVKFPTIEDGKLKLYEGPELLRLHPELFKHFLRINSICELDAPT